MRTLPQTARLYIVGVVCAAAFCAAPALVTAPSAALGADIAEPFTGPGGVGADAWFPLVLLALGYAGCRAALRRSPHGATAPASRPPFDWCSPALLAGAFLLPPAAAALVPVPGALVGRAAPTEPGGGPATASRGWRTARLALATYGSATAFAALGGPAALAADPPRALLPATGAALAYGLLQAGLDRGARAAVGGRGAGWGRPRDLCGSCAPYAVHGLVGLVMALLWHSPYGPPAALLVLVPISVAGWAFGPRAPERATHHAAVRALVQAVDLKDRYTRGHGERVGAASVLIARELGMAAERLEVLRVAGVLHDVGKLGVPTRLLRKNGPLTPQERCVIELHPEHGDAMVRDIACLAEARSAILHHHERLDGSGYPHGLAGRDIPEVARVVAVADAFDAMTSTRSYHRARPVSVAVEELRRCAGSQFDPRMVRALARALDRHGWKPEAVTPEVAGASGADGSRADDGTGECDGATGAACGVPDAAPARGAAPVRGAAPEVASDATSAGARERAGDGGNARAAADDRDDAGTPHDAGTSHDRASAGMGAAYPGAAYGGAYASAYGAAYHAECDAEDAAERAWPGRELGSTSSELWPTGAEREAFSGVADERDGPAVGGGAAPGPAGARGVPELSGDLLFPRAGALRSVAAPAHTARRAPRTDGQG
ncbi:HD-GYP domain-containing protein [Streptomyces buecherae]|uniref:HD domain-containing phosphohydrolase n=1 Tax=Streptomyces buecherae TaxID=2763006 RepID=UPI0018E0738A